MRRCWPHSFSNFTQKLCYSKRFNKSKCCDNSLILPLLIFMILTLLLYTLHDGTLCNTFANTAFSIIHWFIIMIHSSNNGLDNRHIFQILMFEKYGFTYLIKNIFQSSLCFGRTFYIFYCP